MTLMMINGPPGADRKQLSAARTVIARAAVIAWRGGRLFLVSISIIVSVNW